MASKTVLLIEDNRDDEALALRALQQDHIIEAVVVTRDGAEALDYLFARGIYSSRNAQEKPMVVLLDLKLPKIGGFDVLRQIRQDERTRRIPVVVLTSSDEERDITESYNLGASSYVRKPVEFRQFVAAMHQIGLYWTVLNTPPSR